MNESYSTNFYEDCEAVSVTWYLFRFGFFTVNVTGPVSRETVLIV